MKKVQSFLLSQKDEISYFILSNFDMKWLPLAMRFALDLARSSGVSSVWPVVRDRKITTVTLTSEPSEQEGVATLFITFEVVANVRLAPRKIWVTGQVEPYIMDVVEPSTVYLGSLSEALERQEEIRFDCEATAVEDASGGLTKFQMTSVRLKTSITPGTGTITLEGQSPLIPPVTG
jgi:hypothetical protein